MMEDYREEMNESRSQANSQGNRNSETVEQTFRRRLAEPVPFFREVVCKPPYAAIIGNCFCGER